MPFLRELLVEVFVLGEVVEFREPVGGDLAGGWVVGDDEIAGLDLDGADLLFLLFLGLAVGAGEIAEVLAQVLGELADDDVAVRLRSLRRRPCRSGRRGAPGRRCRASPDRATASMRAPAKKRTRLDRLSDSLASSPALEKFAEDGRAVEIGPLFLADVEAQKFTSTMATKRSLFRLSMACSMSPEAMASLARSLKVESTAK